MPIITNGTEGNRSGEKNQYKTSESSYNMCLYKGKRQYQLSKKLFQVEMNYLEELTAAFRSLIGFGEIVTAVIPV